MISRICVILATLAALLGSQPRVLRAAPPPDASLRRSSDEYDTGSEPSDSNDYRLQETDSRYDRHDYGPPPVRGDYRGRYADARMASRRFHGRQPEDIGRPSSWSYDGAPSGPGADRGDGADDGSYVEGPYRGPYVDGPGSDFYHGSGFGDYGDYGDCCDDCYDYNWCSSGPIYVRGEYLLWWLKGDAVPPLVTTSPQGTPRAQAGVLGQPDTTILFGNSRLNTDGRSGGRVVLGWWVDACTRLEGEWFGFGEASANFNQSSNGDPILARPFFNLSTGKDDSNVLAFPGELQGRVGVADTSTFTGAAIRATANLLCSDNCRYRHSVDFVYGYRYLRLKENLTVDSALEVTDRQAPLPLGTTFVASDSFTVSNNFSGAMLGVMAEKHTGCWSLVTSGRLGLGGTWERVTISGQSTATVNGQSTTTPGGLLAMPTNIGSRRHLGFAVVPEVELKLVYCFSPRLKFTMGYDLIYWSRVVRPGDQVDTFVNPTQGSGQPLVGTPGPLFSLRESDLWIQGLSLGGEWCW